MIKLVAENTIKTAIRGSISFSLNKKTIAYPTEHSIKIKTLTRDTKDIDIAMA